MMLDFAQLKEGDWLVQNGANSGVGQNVIQLAKIRGIKTVNIIRDRYPNQSQIFG
jgi:mitochondrial enoyl-[acyl-carrier protein] reductase / trans-2-enoyl-CoA reductase